MNNHCSNEKAVLLKKITQLTKKLQSKVKQSNNGTPNNNAIQAMQKLTLQIYRTTERLKLIECQIKNCKKETKEIINDTVKMAEENKNPHLSFFKKYEKIFKNDKNFTAKNLNQYDIESLKLRQLIK